MITYSAAGRAGDSDGLGMGMEAGSQREALDESPDAPGDDDGDGGGDGEWQAVRDAEASCDEDAWAPVSWFLLRAEWARVACASTLHVCGTSEIRALMEMADLHYMTSAPNIFCCT